VSGKRIGIVPPGSGVCLKTYGGEYDTKMQNYADVYVTYYVIYNPSTLNVTNNP